MLKIVTSLDALPFTDLMDVYIEGNREKGDVWAAEQEFYQYLKQGFFRYPQDRYCLWQVKGKPVSALRLQGYQDGLLLEALETAPEHRRKGYARELVTAVLQQFPGKIYVHIVRGNTASVALHEGCGFRKIADRAVYADGSVTDRAGTWLYSRKVW